MLGVRMDGEAGSALDGLPAVDLAERLRAAYVGWLGAVAQGGPVILAIEDVNWADGSSAALVGAVMALTDRAPIGLVLTLRPEAGSTGWELRTRALADYGHRLAAINLEPLDRAATEELATLCCGGDELDPATRRTLADVSEGNPLFLEELLARLQETGALALHGTWTLTVPRSVLPPNLEGLLVARLDHLGPETHRVTEAAAIIGRRFSGAVLDQVADGDAGAAMDTLLRAGVVVEEGRYPELVYAFRHGLLHEAALSTLTDARRAELHLAVARATEEVYAANLEGHLEELAHHYARAHDVGKALAYLERGAARAEELGAADEAGRLWLRALRAANKLEDGEAADRIRTRIAASGEG
jgi:predicted ATPase